MFGQKICHTELCSGPRNATRQAEGFSDKPCGSLGKGGREAVNDFFSMMEKLQGMFDSEDVEVITVDGRSLRGKIDNLRSTQPFSKPAVKILSSDGKITKILFSDIKDVIDHRNG